MNNLTDLPAIITGGASGMGAATARALKTAGARVAIFDRDLNKAQKVAAELDALALECDVADEKSVESAMHAARQAHGQVRICVNCAGIAPAKRLVGRDGPMPLEDFNQVIRINLLGTFNVMRCAAADMATADTLNESGERGVIINTASVAAYEGQIGQTAYSASKGGIVAMTLPAARDLAKFGIRVMTIAPGIMQTPMLAAMPENVQQSLAESIPFPSRLGKPEEFAQLVLQIITNSYLNGSVIRLDGAIRMQPK